MFIKRFYLLLSIALFYPAFLQAAPAKTGGGYEITVENVDSGGSPATGYSGGDYSLIHAVGEPGGVTGPSGGDYSLLSGFLGQDLIPPKQIDLYSTIDIYNGLINLYWNAPGDDYNAERLEQNTRFFVATTTVLTDAQNPDYWYGKLNSHTCEFAVSTGPMNPGESCEQVLAGLAEGVTYYFRIWTLDQACNWSDTSSGATVYFLFAPGQITDLAISRGQYGKSIKLVWSAPGDDGYTGTLPPGSGYVIQRSTWTGISYSTSSVDSVFFSTSNISPGSYQTCTLTALQQGVTYYVRLWTADEKINWSPSSNSTNTWATWVSLSITLPTTWFSFGVSNTNASTDSYRAAVITNSGNVYQTYSLQATNSQNMTLGSVQDLDTFVLRSAFNAARPGSLAAFDAKNNILNTYDNVSSDLDFTIDGSQTGVGVDPFPSLPANKNRNLWFKLSTPLAVSTSTYQDVYVTITAQESYP